MPAFRMEAKCFPSAWSAEGYFQVGLDPGNSGCVSGQSGSRREDVKSGGNHGRTVVVPPFICPERQSLESMYGGNAHCLA